MIRSTSPRADTHNTDLSLGLPQDEIRRREAGNGIIEGGALGLDSFVGPESETQRAWDLKLFERFGIGDAKVAKELKALNNQCLNDTLKALEALPSQVAEMVETILYTATIYESRSYPVQVSERVTAVKGTYLHQIPLLARKGALGAGLKARFARGFSKEALETAFDWLEARAEQDAQRVRSQFEH